MPVHPDSAGRIYGTTYPADRAPPDAVPLGNGPSGLMARVLLRLAGIAGRTLRVGPGDVLVLRTDRPLPGATVGYLTRLVRAAGGSAAVVLPVDCHVHLEPARLATEDRGYRETRTYGKDADKTRGVWTGVPGAPEDSTPPPDSYGHSEAAE